MVWERERASVRAWGLRGAGVCLGSCLGQRPRRNIMHDAPRRRAGHVRQRAKNIRHRGSKASTDRLNVPAIDTSSH